MPVNALFYLSDLDLIYVKTYDLEADDLDGYVPRSCCRPINSKEFLSINNEASSENYNLSTNPNVYLANTSSQNQNLSSPAVQLAANLQNNKNEESIKYYSLSLEMEYDDLIEDEPYQNKKDSSKQQPYNKTSEMSALNNSADNFNRDSGYRSEIESMTQFSSNYEENGSCMIDKNEISPSSVNKCLMSLQSRSRLPISIRSNLNLSVIDEHPLNGVPNSFTNLTYKSPLNRALTPKLNRKNSGFERNKTRRSLDSTLANGGMEHKFYTISIDIEEEKKQTQASVLFPDLDVGNIELDSLKQTPPPSKIERNAYLENKTWTVILKHEARSLQEVSVRPGMLVHVLKEYDDWICVRILGFESGGQMEKYGVGLIPRNCAVNLQEIIYNSSKSLANLNSSSSGCGNGNGGGHERVGFKRSQITAL